MTKLALHLHPFGRRRNHKNSENSAVEAENNLSTIMMEETLSEAEKIITKWDPEASSYAKITSLFYEDRAEASRFLALVNELQHTMMSFVNTEQHPHPRGSSHGKLVRAQRLMEAAMRRLQKEFYQILASNRDQLDPESVSARSSVSGISDVDGTVTDNDSSELDTRMPNESITEAERMAMEAIADLRAIAETMINAGYGKECVNVYNVLRKSIVDEGLYRLGFEPLTASQVQKMDWQVLDLRIRSWLGASHSAARTLFTGERTLLDNVFSASETVQEFVFSVIAGDAAIQFLAFPELVAKTKRSPEKLFRLLDLYDAITELWPEIEPVFSFESTTGVHTQVVNSLAKLAETARATLVDFEALIQKDTLKNVLQGTGVHPLTEYTMNYIALLADYEPVLVEIYAGVSLEAPLSMPEDFLPTLPPLSSSSFPSPARSVESMSTESSEEKELSAMTVAVQLAWLVLVLLCKLDGKAATYKDVSLSYIFLANNMNYIVNKVRGCRLRAVLGERWAARHSSKARQYAAAYQKLAWGKLGAIVPAGEVTVGEAREKMRAFNAAFEETLNLQKGVVVVEGEMREEVMAAAIGMVVPAYKGFFERWKMVPEVVTAVRFSPNDVRKRLGQLFNSYRSSSGSSSDSDGAGSGFGSNGFRSGSGSDSIGYKSRYRPGSSEGLRSDRAGSSGGSFSG